MTEAEWESLCDNCGRCCLHSVQDAKTGKIKLLAVACRYLDTSTCRCLVYKDRFKIVQDCEMLSPEKIRRIKKLPIPCQRQTVRALASIGIRRSQQSSRSRYFRPGQGCDGGACSSGRSGIPHRWQITFAPIEHALAVTVEPSKFSSR